MYADRHISSEPINNAVRSGQDPISVDEGASAKAYAPPRVVYACNKGIGEWRDLSAANDQAPMSLGHHTVQGVAPLQ